jgi:alcohol sulfotransferase
MVVRYEDMRTDPESVLKEVVDFLGTPGSEAHVKEAVAFAAYENMKKLEEEKAFASSGRRLVPGDKTNPDSFKVRRAKVGGYRDYFDDDQSAEIDRFVRESLSPIYRYEVEGPASNAEEATSAIGKRSAG